MKKNIILLLLFVVFLLGAAGLYQRYSVDTTNPDLSLLQALKKNRLAKFEKLLKAGANPNVVFGRHDWVMGMATDQGKIPYLKQAVDHGGDVNLINPNNSFNRPIFQALLYNNDEAIKYLIEKGADLNVLHCSGCAKDMRDTPVIMAAGFNEYALVHSMIEKKGGLSPFEIKHLIFIIENNLIDLKSEANQWRMKVVEYLRAQGHRVKPQM